MRDHIFRKGDIRGIVGQDLLISEVYAFGKALAFYFMHKLSNGQALDVPNKTIVVGMDGRVHSPAIKDELVRALIDSGFNVQLIGFCPTPVVYYALHTLPVDAGIMITASHNEKEYNGFKICCGKELLNEHELCALKELYKQKKFYTADRQGVVTHSSVQSDYCSWLVKEFTHLQKNTISAVIDCVGGAATALMPALVQQMEWPNVTLINREVDGTFSHACPDPTKKGALDSLAAQVVQQHAALGLPCTGFAFDGDADRLAAMTHEGVPIVSGDLLLALFSEALLQKHPGATIVFDSKCSQVVSTLIEQWGGCGVMSATGHTFVKQKMAESGALLAGELSCHFMFKDRYFGSDDALYALLRFMEILTQTGSTLKALLERFPKNYTTGEVRIPCAEEQKEDIVETVKAYFASRPDVVIMTMDGVRATAPYGWGIVRASNTQPVISFSCEAMTPEGFERIKNDFNQALDQAYKKQALSETGVA